MEVYGAVLQNQPVDVSGEFARQDNHFFIGSEVSEFDPRSASGRILWKGRALKQRVSYHQLTLRFEDYKVWEDLLPGEYEDDQDFSFSLSFVTPRTRSGTSRRSSVSTKSLATSSTSTPTGPRCPTAATSSSQSRASGTRSE
jgi:alpha-D-xyloside xylohydrolase